MGFVHFLWLLLTGTSLPHGMAWRFWGGLVEDYSAFLIGNNMG